MRPYNTKVKSYLKDTFVNMDTKSRVTQAIRLTSAFLSIVLIIALLTGAYHNPGTLYIVKLETSKIDVSKGLFTALREDFAHNELLDDQFGAGLTSSEILTLSDYAENQVKNAPDFITSSLFGWCSTSYHYKIEGDYLTSDDFSFKVSDKTSKCSSPVLTYFFDYRSLLAQSHFEIILEYAYGDTGNNERYISYLQAREKLAHSAPNLLVFTAVSQFVLIGLLIAYYKVKDNGTDVPKLLAHVSSGLSLASFITCSTASIAMTVIYFQFRTDIHKELAAYGFNLRMGQLFFTLLWLSFGMSLLSMASWGGPTWCAPPSPIELDDELGSQIEMFLQPSESNYDIGNKPDAKPTRTSTKKSNLGKGRITSVELRDSDDTTPSPSNFLTNEEEVLLQSNDKIFRSGTFRY